MKAKKLLYVNILVIAALILLNIYQYNKIADLEVSLGSDYQRTIRNSIFVLENDGDPAIWIKFSNEEDGEITLASHLGELTLLGRQYHMMNGKISMIGEILDSLADEYHHLALNIKNNRDYTQNKEEINKKIDFLITLLNNIDSISGENERKYYKEFTDTESKTSNLVWREYKEYEKN